MERSLLTYAEAAALLGLKLPTLYTLVYRRSVPHVRLSGRIVRFDPVVLEAWRKSRAVPVEEGRDRHVTPRRPIRPRNRRMANGALPNPFAAED